MDLRYTPELHNALELVCEQHVVHHAGLCAHVQGWAWRAGGDMQFALICNLNTLWHAQLVTFQHGGGACGDLVQMTFAGSRRLQTWRQEHPKGGAA